TLVLSLTCSEEPSHKMAPLPETLSPGHEENVRLEILDKFNVLPDALLLIAAPGPVREISVNARE
ncbi:hypothetical protein CP02DC16_0719B, partial [Chlamydia psittaci 02DC16]